LALRVGEQRDPLGGGAERDAVPGQAGADSQGDREVGLAGPWGPEQDDVLFAGEEVELAEVLDQRLLDRALEGEVELLERLAGGEPRGLDAALAAVRFARAVLGRQQRFSEAFIAPVLGAGALGEFGQRPCGGRRFERPEQMCELAAGVHAISAS
jgi:hypothetical protein